MEVSQELVERVMAMYKPNYRYLKSAEGEFPIARGRFQLGETEYCETLQHVTDVEAQLCLNQLCYVFFGQGVIEGKWKGLEDLTFDEFLNLRKENMFIVDSHKTFKREIDPKKPFDGQIKATKIRKYGQLYIAKLDFDLDEGASIGKLSLVLKP